jgi:hypothetical protein
LFKNAVLLRLNVGRGEGNDQTIKEGGEREREKGEV